MFFKTSSVLLNCSKDSYPKTFRQSQNPLKINFSLGNSAKCQIMSSMSLQFKCFCKILCTSRIHPSLGRTRREYPEGLQNMEKQMKVKSFNPREGKLQQQKQTVFAKKLNEIQILSQVYNEKGPLH